MVIGNVASDLSGASIAPTMPPVAMMTELFAPASACVTASTRALRRARRSSTASGGGLDLADIFESRKVSLSGSRARHPVRDSRSELQRAAVANHKGAGFACRNQAGLPYCGPDLVEQQFDHIVRALIAERGNPEK